ncbi:hypothetical protein MIR68_003422 [Amoeboaphelidium protococcarum]|nr:hypothetical protein MIR68_003422 [Amoeboaphelidium protococcarum]
MSKCDGLFQSTSWNACNNISRVQVQVQDGIRGLGARVDIAEGEDILQIHFDDIVFPLSPASGILGTERQRLMAMLLIEKYAQSRNCSKFASYIYCLPSGVDLWLPCLALTESQLSSLPRHWQECIQQQRKRIQSDYKCLKRQLQRLYGLHINNRDLAWAWYNVNSRSIIIYVNGQNVLCMIPVFDLLNHSVSATVNTDIG